MIGRLTGQLCEKNPPHLLIDVAGVGYEVEVSMTTIYKLPEVANQVVLYTHFVVREDAQLLYGFHDQRERRLFRALIKVSGVGPKLAIGLLSSIEPDDFVRCVNDEDSASLVKLPGVGKKTAERLIIEMRDRLPDWNFDLTVKSNLNQTAANDVVVRKRVVQDAVSALIALGYKPHDANRAIAAIDSDGKTSQVLIREALKYMATVS